MRKVKLSGSSAKGLSAVLAALSVAAVVVSVLYPWMEAGGRTARVWDTWVGFLDRPLGDLADLALAPLAALTVGFVLLLTGLAGKGGHTRLAGVVLLAAAPLYYVAVVQETRRDPTLEVGFWLVLLAAGLAFASGKAAPARG